MESQTWVAYTAAWLVAAALILLANHLSSRKLNLPPGPKAWPIIGNFYHLGSLPHRDLQELAKKYGPLMRLQFGTIPVLIASSAETVKLFLKTNDLVFAGRPYSSAGKFLSYNYNDMTFAQYGPLWRHARKMCMTELFNPKKLDFYKYIRLEEQRSLLSDLFNSNGVPVLLKRRFSMMSQNVISRMVIGKRYLDESPMQSIITTDEFTSMIDEIFFLTGAFNFGDWYPFIKHFDAQGYVKRMKVASKKFDNFMEFVLDEHNARREKEKENWEPKDLVDDLLVIADDPNVEVKFMRDGIKGFCLDLIAGGTESSALTTEWAISELIRRPDIIAKATKELEQVVGKERWVTEEDSPNLPYIRAIVKETMRMHPVATLLVPRRAMEKTNVNGYDVPKDTVVFVNTHAIQRDPEVYDNPDEFCPERYFGKHKDIDVKGQNFELLPFGAGRRMCPGYSLGLKVIESNLANLLHGFIWKLPGNLKADELDMEEVFGFSNPRKVPLAACVEPRLPNHMYHMLS